MKVLRKLQKHVVQRNYIQLIRNKRVEYAIQGFPLAFTDSWITMRAMRDFRFDGYCITPAATVKKIRRSAGDKKMKHILESEGSLPDNLNEMALPAFDTAACILQHARRNDLLVTVEVESKKKGGYLHIGKIQDIKKESFTMAWIDTDAVWHVGENEKHVRMKNVTQFVFDLDYANLFEKYATRE